jgi:hypothetical protein
LLGATIKLLQGNPISQIPAQVAKEDIVQFRKIAISRLVSYIRVIIIQLVYKKARGIKYYCQLAG